MNPAAFPTQDHEYRQIKDAEEHPNTERSSVVQGEFHNRKDHLTVPNDVPFFNCKTDNDYGQQYG